MGAPPLLCPIVLQVEIEDGEHAGEDEDDLHNENAERGPSFAR